MNGMGGTPLIELYIIYRKAAQIAKQYGLNVVRNLVGSLHHQPGNGGNVDHAAQNERPTLQAVGCSCRYPGLALGLRNLKTMEYLTLNKRGRGSKRPRFLLPKMR